LITAEQIRAARALLRWSAGDLAKASGVGHSTIRRMEIAEGVPAATTKNLAAIQRALEAAGVEFIPENGGGPGVRLRRPPRQA
jgi:transcriptional regulator with XRE-family HTH domain